MNKLYYCLDCKRVFNSSNECNFCKSISIKELTKNSPVNVIGSKIKGRVFKISNNNVAIRYIDEHKKQFIKDFEAEKLRKIL